MRTLCVVPVLACLGCATATPNESPRAAEPPAHASAPQHATPTPRERELQPILITGARVIDGSGREPLIDQDVLLEQGRIAAVGADVPAPAGARVIPANGRTLLPGFIDAHVHLTFTPPANFAEGVVTDMKEHDADRALHGASNAAATLAAGFTTVRNVGGTFADRALRDAIARGDIAGPRMLVANHAITITGGHCDDTNGFHPGVLPEMQDYRAGVADSPDEVRRAIRYQVKHGADVIKLCATGGVMSQGDAVGVSQMTPAELAAAVDEAKRAERKVAAHAHGTEGIKDAIEAGVDSIEHGSVLDDEAIEMMRARGTVLVPTLSAGAHVVAAADAGRLSEETADKAREIAPKMRQSFAKAYAAGVRIALGSDAGVFSHGRNGREFALMVAEGMTPMDAIVAGTSGAASLLGLADVGVVAPGRRADIVLVDGDPLEDIATLQSPAVVIQGGVVVAGEA